MAFLPGVGRMERQPRTRAPSVGCWGAPAGALNPLAINQTASTSSFTPRGTLESTRAADDAPSRSRASSTPPGEIQHGPDREHRRVEDRRGAPVTHGDEDLGHGTEGGGIPVSYTHLRAHETGRNL